MHLCVWFSVFVCISCFAISFACVRALPCTWITLAGSSASPVHYCQSAAWDKVLAQRREGSPHQPLPCLIHLLSLSSPPCSPSHYLTPLASYLSDLRSPISHTLVQHFSCSFLLSSCCYLLLSCLPALYFYFSFQLPCQINFISASFSSSIATESVCLTLPFSSPCLWFCVVYL